MTIFLITFIVMGIALAGMAVGVMAGRPAIKGSCGGLNQVGLSSNCSCSKQEKEECEKKKNT